MDLGEAPKACKVISLDLGKVAEVRRSLPVLASVSPECYAAPVQVFESAPAG
jgi:hypothetical protein